MSTGPEVHLNLDVRGLGPSATVAINERSDALRAAGKRVYKLGLGQSPFPVPDPVVEELRANAHQKAYLPVKGLPALREAVADYGRRRQGLACSAEQVLVGPGSKELMFLLGLVYYGELVVPTPAWVSYAPQAQILGRKVRWLPTTRAQRFLVSAAQLDRLCREDSGRPRLLILNYPSNPTGLTYDPAALAELAEVARRHKVVLLSDEIYGELQHDGGHVSIARDYPEGTIVSSGLSKWCGAGGWRLGTFIVPETMGWLLDAMAAVASETFTSTSAPIQHAAVRAFRGGARLERYLHASRRVLAALGGTIAARLRAAGALLDDPQGAFYVFPDFEPLRARLAARGIHDSATLCERLLDDTGVAVLPGREFGRPETELTARLAYVDFDGARALPAAEAAPPHQPLGDGFLSAHCGDVLEAVDLIAGWVTAK